MQGTWGQLRKRSIFMSTAVLHTEKLCKTFSSGGFQQHVIKNLDIEIREKDFTVIMGSSGSGKSTLLYALSGMDKPSLGKVFFGSCVDILKLRITIRVWISNLQHLLV